MVKRTSITNPSDMNTSEYYNQARYVGKNSYYKGNSNYQCVYYANSRSAEIAKKPVTYWSGTSTKSDVEYPLFNRYGFGNAKDWLKDTNWETGTIPKVGAIMVYGASYGNGLGHVRIVEDIKNNKIIYSAANENRQMAFNKEISIPSISSTGFLGYIYNPYLEEKGEILLMKEDFKKIKEICEKWIQI